MSNKGYEDVPDSGSALMPCGNTLYWETGPHGRTYHSDEVGGGVFVWDTALVNIGTLVFAISLEMGHQLNEARKRHIEGEDKP